MLDALLGFLSSLHTDFIVPLFNATLGWAYDMIVKLFAVMIEFLTYMSIKSTLVGLDFSYDIANQILTDLNVSSQLLGYWNGIPAYPRAWLEFLNVPEALNIIGSSAVTRFVAGKLGVFSS